MRRNPWKLKYWIFLPLARSKVLQHKYWAHWSSFGKLLSCRKKELEAIYQASSDYCKLPQRNQVSKAIYLCGHWRGWRCTALHGKVWLEGLMVQSHGEPWPPQLAGSSAGDRVWLHGQLELLMLLLHHHSTAHPPASPLLLASACWPWHFACLFQKQASRTSWLPENAFARHIPHHLFPRGFDPAQQACLWQGCDCWGGPSACLWPRGWEAWRADGPRFVWTGSSSSCHWARPLRAGSSAEERRAGCSPAEGEAGATGNSSCSGTEEKIVGGGGGPSGLSRKFKTLEGRKKKDSVNFSPHKRAVSEGKTYGLQHFGCFS